MGKLGDDPTEGIRYGQASPDDLTSVKALLAQCHLPSEDLGPGHLDHFILCRSGDRIVGTIGLELLGQVSLLRSFAVAPELRGRGLGQELWARARKCALACGITHLYLLTTTAEGLFSRWGFHRIARDQVAEIVRKTTEYGTMCLSTAVVMTLDLACDQTTADRECR